MNKTTVKATFILIIEILDSLNNNKKKEAYFVSCKGPLIVLIMTFYYLNWDFME